jgi:hypothetical protein
MGGITGKTKTIAMFPLSRLQVITLFYAVALLFFTLYWSSYYNSYSSKKGDEIFTALTATLFITYLYFLALQFSILRINWFLALMLPVLNTIISFLFSVVILWLAGLDGIPKVVILIFGIVYVLLSGVEGLMLWRKID